MGQACESRFPYRGGIGYPAVELECDVDGEHDEHGTEYPHGSGHRVTWRDEHVPAQRAAFNRPASTDRRMPRERGPI